MGTHINSEISLPLNASPCYLLDSTLTGLTINVGKSFDGYMRNFRLWNRFNNYKKVINNKYNYANNEFFKFNGAMQNYLIVHLPLNHPGSIIYNLVSTVNNNDTSVLTAGEFHDSIITTNIKFKTTRYLSNIKSSSQKLVLCEGDTIWDSVSNSCFPKSKFRYT